MPAVDFRPGWLDVRPPGRESATYVLDITPDLTEWNRVMRTTRHHESAFQFAYHGLLLTEGDLVTLRDGEDVVTGRVVRKDGLLVVGPIVLADARREGRYEAEIIAYRPTPAHALPTEDGLYRSRLGNIYRLTRGSWTEIYGSGETTLLVHADTARLAKRGPWRRYVLEEA